jgi:hypothetical protein
MPVPFRRPDVTLTDAPPKLRPASGRYARLAALWGVRLLFVVLGLAAWFGTQHLIGCRTYTGTIGDGILDWLTPVHTYLTNNIAARNALLISSSAVIDLLALFLFGRSIFGPTLRPFLGLLILFSLRQIFQGLCVLPMPEGMIWPTEGPGFPSLFVTYGVSNDLFFSGHTAMAVFGAIELTRLAKTPRSRAVLIPLGIAIALFEIFTVLALRAHWTMDVYAGLVSAILIACLSTHLAPPVDRLLAKVTGSAQ